MEQQEIQSQLNQTEKQKCCKKCQKQEEKLQLCNGCKEIFYCSSKCQRDDWQEHKKVCKWQKQKEEEQKKKLVENLPVYKQICWFNLLEVIGRGNFSDIHKAQEIKTSQFYAIKVINRNRLRQVNKEKDVEMERHCLRKLNDSDYVIKLIDYFSDEQTIYIQMELVEGNELWHRVRGFGSISPNLIIYYLAHLVNAVEYIHSKGIAHRDLKPENIMVTRNHQLKLIDFGTAKDVLDNSIQGSGQGAKGKRNYEHFVGTPNFMAPEQIRNKSSGYESDIYQLGGVFFQIASGFPPNLGGSQYIIFQNCLEKELYFHPLLFEDQLKDLIQKMMDKVPEKRINFNQIKQHPYFKDIDFKNIPSYMDQRQKLNKIDNFLVETQKSFYKNLQTLEENNLLFEKEFNQYFENLENQNDFNDDEKNYARKRLKIMEKQALVTVNLQENFEWESVQDLI